ncbi:YadA family autotransporter adhesin [Bergeriella denitrificans]|uniref:YadA family autotransporter adhesin n=1 Tax=Bergeriella denitrificans TaxID=494 RepID=UPI00147066CC|nr:YadA C-terminal domain-containing protein [Bergeriella denitrificans]
MAARSGKAAVAIGRQAAALNDRAVAIGGTAVANEKGAVALGSQATATAAGAVAIGGSNADALTDYDAATATTASATNAIAIGQNAKATTANSVALGNGTTTAAASKTLNSTVGDITFGDFAGQSVTGTVSVGSSDAQRTISNLAAGALSTTSTDAVNGSQLHATNTVVANVAKSVKGLIGGKATVDPKGNITTTDIGGTGATTVDGAIANLKGKIDNFKSATVSAGDGIQVTPTPVNGTTDYKVALSADAKDKLDQVGDLAKDVAANKTAITNLNTTTTNLTTRVAANEKGVAGNKAAIEKNAADITDLSGKVATNTTNIANNKAATEKNAADITDLSGKVAANTTNIANNASKINTLENNFNDLTAEVGKNATAIATNAVDIADNKAAIAANKAANDAKNAEQDQAIRAAKTEVQAGSADVEVIPSTGAYGQSIYTVDMSAVNKARLQNVDRLDSRMRAAEGRLDKMDKRISDLDDKFGAMGASTMATAGLMQSYRPGQSNASIAVGQNSKHRAIAAGVSTISDGGKWGVKAAVAVNTEKDVSSSLGVSWFW